ncbi:hypothetical protein [Rahnella ecdela]|uniref:Uncharacterized protein n=1 Tax=Rahnella ecdela TaxID=2816250 RepID=A0ABS6LGW4_9GAMM|nr:hypothetical protein [Rahnella ecdela]MBU9846057.1 hypothetical protein [Rahnella ecdela]
MCNMFYVVAGIALLLIISVYVIHATERIRNSNWVIDTIMVEYNYSEDLAREIVLQVDTLTKCKVLRTDKEIFMRIVRQYILNLTNDEPII